LGCSEAWGIPPWTLEELDQTDETVALWIHRKVEIDNMYAKRLKREQGQAERKAKRRK